MEGKGFIYCIENKVNGKKYVGMTGNWEKRRSQHISRLKNQNHSNPELQRDYNKHKLNNFAFYILEEGVSQKIISEREIYFVDKLNSFNEGYNRTLGGGLLSEEHRRKLSEAHKGKVFKEETRLKLKKRALEQHKRGITAKGTEHYFSKIDRRTAIEIYKKYKTTDKYQYEIAEDYNIDQAVVCRINTHKHWTTKELTEEEILET